MSRWVGDAIVYRAAKQSGETIGQKLFVPPANYRAQGTALSRKIASKSGRETYTRNKGSERDPQPTGGARLKMVRRRERRSTRPAILVAAASAAVAAAGGAGAVGGGRGPRYAGTDPKTDTYQTSWDSSPFNLESVTDNNLGLMAKSCSEQFCHAGINGLDLWISFEEVSATRRFGWTNKVQNFPIS